MQNNLLFLGIEGFEPSRLFQSMNFQNIYILDYFFTSLLVASV
jgi:hypothetical protein